MTPNWSASPIGCRIAATVQRRATVDVLVDHLREVHAIDVVGADHDDDVGLLVAQQVERLEDRVGAAQVPVLADPLLRRDRGDVVAEHRRHPPGLADVPVEAVGLVLRQHHDLQVAAVDDVGQREVDQAVDAGERDRRVWRGRRSAASAACPHRRPARWPGPSVGGAHAANLAARSGSRNRRRVRRRTVRRLDLSRRPLIGSNVTTMRVDVLTKEYPPEIYGGAGVHVAELVRALRSRDDVEPGCMPSAVRATRRAPRPTPTWPSWPAPTPLCAPSASTWPSPTAAPAPTWCTRTPGTPTWPATSRRCCTASRT